MIDLEKTGFQGCCQTDRNSRITEFRDGLKDGKITRQINIS